MKNIFLNKQRRFSIRKLKVGIASIAIGLVFVDGVTGLNYVEASLSTEDANYINQTAPNNGALVEYIRQALETISKAADSTVLPTSIQNLKNKVQLLSTKNESNYTESAWQVFQGKLTTAKSVLAEAEKAYNKAVTIKPNTSSYETTINELITSYPEYNTVVVKVREGESTEDAENRHLTNIRRISGVLTAKYSELSETANSIKKILPSVGSDLAAQQLETIKAAETILEVNKKTPTAAVENHADLMAGLFEDNKVVLSGTSNLRGTITPEDQAKIKTFLDSYSPSIGETSVFQTFSGALQCKFNNDGTVTITYTDDGSSDTVPLSIFAKGGSTQTDSPAATYSVTYNYVSGTPDKTLPSSITAPAVVNEKHTGDVVTSPSGQTDVEDAANQGTWHFNGWDKASVTIGTANEVVTGIWIFTTTLGENPSTTPGTTTPGETPGTETPGGNPEMPNPPVHELPEFNGGVPGIPEVHDKPQFNGGVPTPGTSTTSNPRGTTPRTTYLFVTSKEDKTLPNSVVEGWSKKDGQWLYQLEDGSHIVNEWKQINGTWYHFDNSGVMQTGWIKENGTWYYLNKSGAMQTGWVKENGTWYYLNDSGAMQTGWVKENGTWYYLNQSGSMETGWFTVSDKWYYANESGALAINTTTPDGYNVNADGEWVE